MKESRYHARFAAWRASALAAFLLMSSAALPLCGQGVSYISGYIFDATGAVVPKAAILITDEASGIPVTTESNQVGLFRSPALKPGTYRIEVTAPGFKKLTRSGQVLDVGQPLGLNLTLELGAETTTVEVTAETPLLRTEDAGLGQTVKAQELQRLPFLDKRFGASVVLTPGGRYNYISYTSFNNTFVDVNGMGAASGYVNGASVQHGRNDNSYQDMSPTSEVFSEMRVLTNQFSAEHGIEVGATFITETKSGTNNYHGSLYHSFRNEALDTMNALTRRKPLDRQHIFGGTLGGPIVRDKLLIFGSYEGWKMRFPSPSLQTVPTAAMKAGDFSGLKDNSGNPIIIYDPATTRTDPATGRLIRDPFPNNTIPQNRFDPVAKKVLGYLPDPDLPGSIGGGQNLSCNMSIGIDKHRGIVRTDWKPGPKDQFTGNWMYDYHKSFQPGCPASAALAPFAAINAGGNNYDNHLLSGAHTRTFSPTMFLESRVTVRWRRLDQTNRPTYDPEGRWAQTLGIKNAPASRLPSVGDLGFPRFAFTNYASMSSSLDWPQRYGERDFSVNLTRIQGRHSMKTGFWASQTRSFDHELQTPNGSFNFALQATSLPNVAGTGNSIASALLGLVNGASADVGVPMKIRSWYYASFVQDDWKATSKLTINLGLRWDIDAPLYEKSQNALTGFDLDKINPVSGTPGVITFYCRNGLPCSQYDTDYRRFAPRFGFAYQLNPKLVVRGGYGIYNTTPRSARTGFGPAGWATRPRFSSPDGGITPAFILANGFPDYSLGGDPKVQNDGFGAVPVGQRYTTNPSFQERKYKIGRTQNFNLNVQYELARKTVLEVAGMGVLGRNLAGTIDLNEAPPQFWGQTGSVLTRRRFPQFGYVQNVNFPFGTTNYYGGHVRLERRFSDGLSLTAWYNLGKTIGNYGGGYNFGNEWISIYKPELSHGYTAYSKGSGAGFQSPHSAVVSWVYELPAGPNKKHLVSGPLSKVLGGWYVSGILSMYSGMPFNIQSGFDSLNGQSDFLNSRVNLVGDPKQGGGTVDRWFNTKAFAAPAFGTIGSYWGGHLKSPAQRRLDLSVSKDVRVNERWKVKFSADFFNFTNTPQYLLPNTNMASPNFGRITAGDYREAAVQRIIQFGLNITF